jgi:phosphoglycerol transferase MdoB-like AlkP superfamily enzyme
MLRNIYLSWSMVVLAVLLWCSYPAVLWWLDRGALMVAADAYTSLSNAFVNALPGLAVALLIAAITRRFVFPILLVGLLQLVIYIASKLKLSILGSPFELQDFYFLTAINKASIELFSVYLDKPGAALAIAVAVVLGLVIAAVLERPRMRWLGRRQGGLFAISLLALVSLYAAGWPWTGVYNSEEMRPSPLSKAPAVPAVLRSGLFSTLVFKYLQKSNMHFTVDAVALNEAVALLPSKLEPQAPAAGQRPDVIVILSESFMDPRIIAEMGSVRDPIPATRRYLESGQGGALRVPTYGGGTVRTEFEVLTGMPVAAFPEVSFPYVDLDVKPLPSLPGYLKGLGYDTLAIHGNSGSFWERTKTYAAMGINRFLDSRDFREKHRPKDGMWFSDQGMTDSIIEELEDATVPTFVMAVSMENHGPYNHGDPGIPFANPQRRDAVDLPPVLTGNGRVELQNYLYHLEQGDDQLQRLVHALDDRKRPYVLAFFGDHLPAMASTWEQLQFVDGKAAWQQSTPWLLVSSNGRSSGQGRVIHSWQLPAEVLDIAGLKGDDYFDLVFALGRRIEGEADPAVRQRLHVGLSSAANARISGKRLSDHVK